MRNKAAILLAVLIFFCFTGTVQAKSYSIPEVFIQAEVMEDGTVEIIEHRTFDFKGSFSWLEQWIFKKGDSFFRLFYIMEDGQYYAFDPDNYRLPGSFYVEDLTDKVVVRWYYQAQDEQRTFSVGYTAFNVVWAHQDTAEFYYQFIGDDWEIPTGKAVVEVTLPQEIPPEEIKAWGHGPLYGEVSISGNTVTFEVEKLPGDRFLEGRILFPPEYIPLTENYSGKYALEEIMEEEAQWAKMADRERLKAFVDWAAVPVFSLITLCLILFFYFKYGKEFKPDFQGDYYRELPGKYGPAVMSYLYRFKKTTTDDITATIMDLARRGHIIIVEELDKPEIEMVKIVKDYKIRRPDKAPEDILTDHERYLLDFLMTRVQASDEDVSFNDIVSHAIRNPESFQTFYSNWKYRVQTETNKYSFFDNDTADASRKEMLLGVGFIAAGVILFFFKFLAAPITLIVCGVLLLIFGAVLRRRSPEGVNQFVRWKAFRKFLLHFSSMDQAEIPSLIIWEHYLVYAIALGVAEQVMKQLEIVFPNLQEGGYAFGTNWYLYRMDSSTAFSSSSLNITRMSSRLENSLRTASKYHPVSESSGSSSGGGGGFSSGGGGGFGGGGGRAG